MAWVSESLIILYFNRRIKIRRLRAPFINKTTNSKLEIRNSKQIKTNQKLKTGKIIGNTSIRNRNRKSLKRFNPRVFYFENLNFGTCFGFRFLDLGVSVCFRFRALELES